MDMPEHVITGAHGFIGSRLGLFLEKRCKPYVPITYDTGMGGILDRGRLLRLFKDKSVVFHLGAISGSKFFDDLSVATRVNCEGTANVLEAARVNDVGTVVFASTSSCYAFGPVPHREEDPPKAINSYVATKLYGEYLMKLFADLYGIRTVIMRFGSVYGIGEGRKGSVANPVTQFLNTMLEGRYPLVYGKGKQKRDLIFADDVAEALFLASWSAAIKPGDIYNVATGTPISFNKVIELIGKVLKTHIKPMYVPYPKNKYQTKYIEIQYLDTSKFRAIGWAPKVGLEEGLKRIVASKTGHAKSFLARDVTKNYMALEHI